jgi:toxin CcdB
MAQFDVYRNPSQKTKEAFPYIVDVQHSIINDLTTRLVIPLGNTSIMSSQAITPQLTSLPIQVLKQPIGTVELQRHYIIDALDFAITGI